MRPRRLVGLLAAASAAACVGLIRKAVGRFRRPFPAWMVDADQWYDCALAAALAAVIAGCCVVYLYRTRAPAGRERGAAVGARPTRWRERAELRVALYGVAAFLSLQLPLGAVKAARALNDPRPPWRQSFWSAVPAGAWLGPPAAAAIALYDRRRTRRESREDEGRCLGCGYDLRATPGRCPECGATPPAPPAG